MRDAANEALAVEHVADQPPVFGAAHRVARARHLDRRRNLVEQGDDRDLVRHGDERAVEVGEPADLGECAAEILPPDTHRNDGGVEFTPLEPRIVDHRRLEGRRRIADMGDDLRVAVDHVCGFLVA